MSDPALGLLMLTLIVIVIMMGFATAFTLMGLGIIFGFIAFYDPGQAWTHNKVFDLMVQRTYGAMTNDVLISIPLFVLMGYVMERGALVDKMFYSIQLAFRRVPAALAVATLIVCTFWGIASGLVGAVVVLMGVIAFNPMLRAGYDVKLASGVITAGGTLGILIPPSVMIIVYAAVAGQSVVKLYAAAMFPGFFLAFLYLIYVIGWALVDPRIAPRLPEEQTRVPVPGWVEKFQAAYSRNLLVGFLASLFSPRRAASIEAEGKRLGYGALLLNFVTALVPLLLAVLTMGGLWWYVVIHQQVGEAAEVAGVQQLGTPGITTAPATEAELGPSPAFFMWFAAISVMLALVLVRYYWRMDAARFVVLKLLTASVMPLGILTVVVLAVILFGITTATESAAVGAAGAFLLAFQARTLDWKRTKEAVFLTAKTTAMVCWLFVGSALFSAVFAILGGQGLVERWTLSLDMTPLQFMLLSQAIIFVLGWPLEWTEIIIIFVPIFLPLLKHYNIDPILWGTMVFVNLQAAFLSPPVAMSAFYLKGVSPSHVTINQIFAGMMPYMLIVILCLAIMYVWPGMTLWLPNYLYGS
jgi:TRAP-type mannitol/chloroaromatic compound transport system permease large subunit